MTDKELSMLTEAGEALFGSRWQTDTARILGYADPARLRRILSGERPFPPDGWQLLAEELRHRSHITEVLAVKLDKIGAP